MNYFLNVSEHLEGWKNVRDKLLNEILTTTDILIDESSGWIDIDQKILQLTVDFFKQIRLKPVHVALYVSKGIEKHPIHLHPTHEHARLNIPILNYKNTSTVFYKTDKMPSVVKNKQDVELLELSENDCTEIARTTVDSPTVLHIRTPHRVIAPTATRQHPRVMSTFQFNRDPVFLLR